MGAIYDIAAGLDTLVPDANYSGSLKYNTEQEYDNLIWADDRPKPTFIEVDAAALNVMRQSIARDLNDRTRYEIITNFRTSIDPTVPIESTMEWQFDVLNLWLNRDSGIFEYPYQLYCSLSEESNARYINVADSSVLHTIYLEMFGYVDGWLKSGRDEKSKLASMTREELEVYEDPR